MSHRNSRGFISLGLIVILTSMHFSTAVSANPNAPEIYEFSVSPSVLDLTNGDGVVRIRLGARDSDGINDLFGWCHGEPHSDSVRLQIEPRWFDDFGKISLDNTVVSWSYDDIDLFVDLESETIYAALTTMSAVHNCQVTATDNLGNQTTAYTQFNIVKSSPINTPTADASASNSSTAAPGTKTPSPSQPSNSESDADSNQSPHVVPEVASGVSESGPAEGEQDPTFLVVTTAFATALILGAGIFIGRRFGPMSFRPKKQKR